MITLAVAALALGAPAKRQASYILPLYDMVTSVDANGNVTVNFMLSATWSNTRNNYSNFSFYFFNGTYNHFSPDGGWQSITPSSWTPITGSQVTVWFPASQFNGGTPTGTIWVMYNGNPTDSPNGAEYSVAAAEVGQINEAGHGGRPGYIVPIKDETPDEADKTRSKQNNYNVPIAFNIDTPFNNTWGSSYPHFWANNGPQNSAAPGHGWQTLNANPVAATPGFTGVSTTAHPVNNNAGFYCAGSYEQYVPNETYNPGGTLWWEFSAVIRPYTVS